MNARDRVLAAIRCQPVDRIPLAPLIGGYARGRMPSRYQEMRLWEFYAEFGLDLFIRNVACFVTWPPQSYVPASTMLPSVLSTSLVMDDSAEAGRGNGIEVRRESKGHETLVTVETPIGTLRSVWLNTPGSPHLPFCTEHLLKTMEDLKIYQYVLERTKVRPSFAEMATALAALGNTGIADAYGHSTPVQDLIMFHMGLKEFVFMLEDHRGEVETLMTLMQDVRKREYQVLAESPAEIVVTYENTSTTLLSPKYMARYEFPSLAEYSDILHAAGKLHLVHMCGRIRQALPLIAASPFDGVIDTAPLPTGDLDFHDAREILSAAGKCIGGGIDCTAFIELGADQMKRYVQQRLREVAPGTGFLLGSGDAVPIGVPLENLHAVVDAVHEHGSYPLNC